MRAKRNTLSFNIDEIERADTIKYIDDTDIGDVRQNKKALITAKEVSQKYKRLTCKRKRNRSPETIKGPIKKPATSGQSKKSAIIAARKITEKYKKMRNR